MKIKKFLEKIKCLREIPTIIFSILVISSLLFYASKYYQQAELIFNKNQFNYYLVFVLLVIWIVCVLFCKIHELSKQNKIITEQNQLITKQNEMMVKLMQETNTLVNIIAKESLENHDEIITQNQNTRKLILQAISKEV